MPDWLPWRRPPVKLLPRDPWLRSDVKEEVDGASFGGRQLEAMMLVAAGDGVTHSSAALGWSSSCGGHACAYAHGARVASAPAAAA